MPWSFGSEQASKNQLQESHFSIQVCSALGMREQPVALEAAGPLCPSLSLPRWTHLVHSLPDPYRLGEGRVSLVEPVHFPWFPVLPQGCKRAGGVGGLLRLASCLLFLSPGGSRARQTSQMTAQKRPIPGPPCLCKICIIGNEKKKSTPLCAF